MNLWRALFGSMRRQSAAPTASASQAENIPALRNAPAPLANRKFESPFKIGDRIGGRYEVRRILGGGMGVVYVVYDHEARNVLAPKILALKTFQDRTGQNFAEQHALERAFEKEASAWIALDDHFFIVQATSVQRFHGRLFIAMEYIPPDDRGRNTLRHFLVGHPLPLEQVLRWGSQFCHGMEHAFSKGVLCHRDIKPDNILISVFFKGLPLPEIIPDDKLITIGYVKITDFGLAGALDQSMGVELAKGLAAMTERNAEGDGLTVLRVGKGQMGGTPGYVAPEVLRGDGADVRSDVYSFGVVLYQMVTGNPSLPLVNRYQLTPLARVDSVLWPVIERCLQAEARSRYQSFRLLREELEDLLRRAGGVVPSLPLINEPQAWEWSNKGFSLSTLGRNDEALACYDRALEIDGTDGRFWLNKGNALSDLGRKQEAIVCYDRALEIDPRLAAAWSNKGNELSALGRKEEAIVCFDRALEINPRDARVWNGKGVALSALEHKGEALACYDRALEIDPKDETAWNSKGTALSALGRNDEALACYDRALEINPRDARPWNNKAAALSILGRKEEALACYGRVLEIEPGNAQSWYDKGCGLWDLGRKQDAIFCYNRALEVDPRHAAAWNNKGFSLWVLGRKQEAVTCYDRALEIEPTLVHAWNNKGNALSEFGRKEEAIVCYDRALEIEPKHAAAWFRRGEALSDLGRYQEAIICYDGALEIDPRFVVAWNNKGLALLPLGRKHEAIACYDRTLEIDPEYAGAWINKGNALLDLGRKEEAIVCYDRALVIDPRLVVAWYNMGKALAGLGRKREAADAYRRFIAYASTPYAQYIQGARQLIAELEANPGPGRVN